MTTFRAKILIIDDDEAVLALYEDVLSPQYEVTTIAEWLDGANLVLSGQYALLILDLRMSVFDLVAFINRLRRDGPPISILVCSASTNLRERVAGASVDAILAKPSTIPELEQCVAQLLEHRSTANV